MTAIVPLDRDWLAANPLPQPEPGIDKNQRGRVLVAGGSLRVPGAVTLTAEAAFRAGAGKVQLAVIEATAIAIGLALPEAGVIGLRADDAGEIDPGEAETLLAAAGRADAAVIGPGMGASRNASALVATLLKHPLEVAVVLDAAAATCAAHHEAVLRAHRGGLVLTPHQGEMAALLDCDIERVTADPEGTARAVAARFGAVVALKSAETVVADPDGTVLHYAGGGVGLATGGSGDVLAGIVGALLARGASPLVATGWAVWLHGEAGHRLAETVGPIGFLARELIAEVPRLMAEATKPADAG